MPDWIQLIGAAAATVIAGGVLWTKVIRPVARFITHAEEMLPLLRDLTKQLADTPQAFAVLKDIVAQFRSNSGSSLRDVVDRLEHAAKANHTASEVLKVNVEVVRQLSEQDRMRAARMMAMVTQLEAKMAVSAATGLRIEEAAAGVADDLAAAQRRADEVGPEAPAGEAADAASQGAP